MGPAGPAGRNVTSLGSKVPIGRSEVAFATSVVASMRNSRPQALPVLVSAIVPAANAPVTVEGRHDDQIDG